jgi:hypothetical protein
MGNAALQAITNMTNAAAIPLAAPGGCETCPRGAVRIGVFFDGTGNNRFRDEPHDIPDFAPDPVNNNGRSAVAKLYALYIEQGSSQKRVYHHGVGTDGFQRGYKNQYNPDHTAQLAREGEQPSAAENASVPRNDPWLASQWTPDQATTDATSTDGLGNTAGAGATGRVEWGLKQLSDFYSNNGNHLAVDHLYDAYGFSRGAAIARDFVNTVKTRGVINQRSTHGVSLMEDEEGNVTTVQAFDMFRPPIPMFLGIFDTVASMGVPPFQTADQLGGFKMFIDHTYVRRTIHLIAEDEFRIGFPVTSLFGDPNDEGSWIWTYRKPSDYARTMVEIWYPGAHCDVGGAYLLRPPRREDGVRPPDEPGKERGDGPVGGNVIGKRQHLANIPLRDMHAGSLKATVPLRDLHSLSPAKLWEVPGDLEDFYSQYDSYRQPLEYGVGKRYIQTYDSDRYRDMFYGPRVWLGVGPRREGRINQPNFQRLKYHFIHNSAAEFVTSVIDDNLRWQRTVLYMGGLLSPNQPAVGATER